MHSSLLEAPRKLRHVRVPTNFDSRLVLGIGSFTYDITLLLFKSATSILPCIS